MLNLRSTVLVALAALVAFAVFFGSGLTSPDTASAASCQGTNACLANTGVIGADSCNGDFACAFNSGTVGANSCNGTSACVSNAQVIGDGSCNDPLFGCQNNEGTIGNGSCNDGSGSCGTTALFQNNTGTIGNNSCNNGDNSCQANSGDIGDNSCNNGGSAGSTCFTNTVLLSHDSCNGPKACWFNSSGIGDNSCNNSGEFGCWNISAPIGRYSCNGDANCLGSTSTVGDCEINDVDPPPCVSIDFDVTKTASTSETGLGGGDVVFSVAVENLDPFEIELTSLVDDVFGNLDGEGSCSVPQTIASGDSYNCSITAMVDEDHVNTVTAEATDEHGNSGSREDSSAVDVPFNPAYVPDPDASQFPQLGGTPIPTSPLAPTQTESPSDSVSVIQPPSTGDGGLLGTQTTVVPVIVGVLLGALFMGALGLSARRAEG